MKTKATVLCTGLNEVEKAAVLLCTGSVQAIELACDADVLMEQVQTPAPVIVFCGSLTGEMNPSELAQLMRSVYQDTQIYYVASNRQTFKRDVLIKNGFNDAFLVPIDTSTLADSVSENFAKVQATTEKSYRSVSLIDIAPETVLSFDVFVFLPMNGKHVRYSAANEVISNARVERLKTHQVKSLHVTAEQMPAFYKFTADQLKKMDSPSGLSETERSERKKRAVRDLMSQMFATDTASDFAGGQELVKDCNEIIKAYVVADGKNSWYEKIMSSSGEAGGSYSHSANVATFAALFSLGLGIGNPDELAMAGLLHDIGIAELPPEIQTKKEHELTLHEKALYNQHPVHSINMLKQKRIVVSEKVIRAIVEHHERATGGGYPNSMPGDRICKEGQVLAMADVFSELTSTEMGKSRLSPIQAIQKMINDTANSPSTARFDLVLLRKLVALFPTDTAETKELSA